jgi:hypothetical protein
MSHRQTAVDVVVKSAIPMVQSLLELVESSTRKAKATVKVDDLPKEIIDDFYRQLADGQSPHAPPAEAQSPNVSRRPFEQDASNESSRKKEKRLSKAASSLGYVCDMAAFGDAAGSAFGPLPAASADAVDPLFEGGHADGAAVRLASEDAFGEGPLPKRLKAGPVAIANGGAYPHEASACSDANGQTDRDIILADVMSRFMKAAGPSPPRVKVPSYGAAPW